MKRQEPRPDIEPASAAAVTDRIRPGTARRVQILAGVAALTLLIGFVATNASRSRSSEALAAATGARAALAPAVVVATVEPAPSVSVLTLPGETAAWHESTIYARVDGYVGHWFADIGDHVEEGQVLATIETPGLDARLVAARARLDAAKAELQVRRAEAEFARTTHERWQNSPKGVVSEQEREDKKAGFASAKAKVSAALSQISLAEAEVERLAADERFKQVRAPFAGTIVQRRIDIGNLVTAGSAAGNTPLYRMTRNDPIRVFVEAPQAVSESMKVGTPVRIHVNAAQNRLFDGRITRTARAVDPHARTLRVEIDIPNHDDVLLPGLYVRVGFHLDRTGTAQVPAAALVARAAGPQVAVVAADDTVEFRDVSIARDDGKTVDLASGVAPGDRVILNISNQIAAGQKVRARAEGSHLVGAAPAAAQRSR
jgi:membrane fusion protein, multidrug efflux system